MRSYIYLPFALLAATIASGAGISSPLDTKLSALSGTETLSSPTSGLFTRGDCSKESKCNESGCKGINRPHKDSGICTAGEQKDCPCKNVCGESNGKCDHNDCDGLNDPVTEGKCLGERWSGCRCNSVCGKESGDCDKSGCEGVNRPFGQEGFCTAGKYNGCACKSICGDKPGKCSESNCKGEAGICQSGKFKGCPCDGECSNLSMGKCGGECEGIEVTHGPYNVGVCQKKWKGCPCELDD